MLSHEITIAELTLEGFLTSVGLHVCFETTPVRKFPIAVHTLEGLLTSVRSHVHCETALSFIFLVTVIALERQKGTNVPLEGSQCRACSATAITLKRVCVVTSLNMFPDLSNSFTGFTAESTSVGVFLLPFFLHYVSFQLRN